MSEEEKNLIGIKIKHEVEKLINENEMLQDNIYKLQDQLQQKENIIKEVREYIENNGHYDFYNLDVAVDGEKLLEILDKGE